MSLRQLFSTVSWRRFSTNVLVAKSYNLPTIRLFPEMLSGSPSGLMVHLQQRVSLAPNFYRCAPIVVDAEEVSNEISIQHLKQFTNELNQLNLHFVGVVNISSELQKEAQNVGISTLTSTKGYQPNPIQNTKQPQVEINEEKTKLAFGERKEIIGAVRSGQLIHTRGPRAQLVVMGNVARGAEIISDGDIHIYGTLYGRALAGASGDDEAKIFVTSMKPELVAVGGLFTAGDLIPQEVENGNVPCMIFVSEKKLLFAVANKV